jgi:hypothetical protein
MAPQGGHTLWIRVRGKAPIYNILGELGQTDTGRQNWPGQERSSGSEHLYDVRFGGNGARRG